MLSAVRNDRRSLPPSELYRTCTPPSLFYVKINVIVERLTGLLKETGNYPVNRYISSELPEDMRNKYGIEDACLELLACGNVIFTAFQHQNGLPACIITSSDSFNIFNIYPAFLYII